MIGLCLVNGLYNCDPIVLLDLIVLFDCTYIGVSYMIHIVLTVIRLCVSYMIHIMIHTAVCITPIYVITGPTLHCVSLCNTTHCLRGLHMIPPISHI